MSTPSSPPKKPKLSLQTKVASSGPNVRSSSRTLGATVNPSSPTSFNTLSNVYVTAIDRSTPVQQAPPATALSSRTGLFSPIRDDSNGLHDAHHHVSRFGAYLDTPVTAQPQSPQITREVTFPSTMTATPPLSAGPVDPSLGHAFFAPPPRDSASRLASVAAVPSSPRTPYRRVNSSFVAEKPPYTHPRSLHSILRNSPLVTAVGTRSPMSPTRRSLRLQEKAAKKVAYNSPLEQTITTNKYVKSHIDLLCEDGSPYSPINPDEDPETALDRVMAYTPNETRDGGQTPGPFEEMRRRMTGLATTTPTTSTATSCTTTPATSSTPGTQLSPSSGVRKRKRREKKRRWVWTIGQDEDEDGYGYGSGGSPLVAERLTQAASPPKPAVSTVPVIAVPAPRLRRGKHGITGNTPSLVTPATTAPTPHLEQRHTPPPAFEPASSAEPPTPSVGSSVSLDSVFEEASADVDMSDASSVSSDDNNGEKRAAAATAAATALASPVGMMDLDA